MLCQDITVTLILDDMDTETYQKKIKMLSEMDSNGELNIMTYDPEKPAPICEELSEDQKKFVKKLVGEEIEEKEYSSQGSVRKIKEEHIPNKVSEIISEMLNVEPKNIYYSSNFADDLGADSLDLVELLMTFEEEYELDIPDHEAEELVTVSKVIDYLKSKGKLIELQK